MRVEKKFADLLNNRISFQYGLQTLALDDTNGNGVFEKNHVAALVSTVVQAPGFVIPIEPILAYLFAINVRE
ncbi:hypothetical protein D3C77_355720 [compost metagenome]